ncbi:hypothetical protein SAMN05192548_1003141 [Paraburkholderia terricola]|uniref:Uncharacterized protein n=1 Tax=Paraburkholderia terricola TaxID=169427 RepID=A0A1M6KAE0_9BURK|nr:hypothetical protein SAMN05192547_1003106 [Paraburkholderia sediminicola]SHJ55899.1 hypothetical protein SAMN05192548_1003141 [Paraburkholderia terricola]
MKKLLASVVLSAEEPEQLKAPFQRGRNARAHGGGCRFIRARAEGWNVGGVAAVIRPGRLRKRRRLRVGRAAQLRSSHASRPTRKATPAITGTVSMRMMPKFGIGSP